jgi:hypothetical protein
MKAAWAREDKEKVRKEEENDQRKTAGDEYESHLG